MNVRGVMEEAITKEPGEGNPAESAMGQGEYSYFYSSWSSICFCFVVKLMPTRKLTPDWAISRIQQSLG